MSIEYHNLMEDVVLRKVDEVMNSMNACKCDTCRADVITYALNHLQPCYVTTNLGEIMVEIGSYENQFKADVLAQLMEACQKIADNPRHDK